MSYLAALLLSSLLGYAYTCSCVQTTDHDNYCNNADFGVLIKTKNNGTIVKGEKRFQIKLLETYKSDLAKGEKVKKNVLYTGMDGGQCGANLKENTVYFVSGYYDNNNKGYKTKMRISSCGFRKEIKIGLPDCEATLEL